MKILKQLDALNLAVRSARGLNRGPWRVISRYTDQPRYKSCMDGV